MAYSRTDLGKNIPPTQQTLGKSKNKPQPTFSKIGEESSSGDEDKKQKMLRLSLDLESMRKDQHHLILKQEKQYGTTIDTINEMQADIDKAKSQNNSLIGEMKVEKERIEQLQSHFFDLHKRLERDQKTLRALKREKELWEDSKTLLVETEDKCKRLSKSNRLLRALLLKHHINPDVDATTMGNTIHIQKPKADRKLINAVSPRSRLTPGSISWR